MGPSMIVNGFQGRRFRGEAIEGTRSDHGVPPAALEKWLQNHIGPLTTLPWRCTDAVQQPPIFVNSMYKGRATVVAYATEAGDRVEYWTSEDPSGDLQDDFCALLQTSSGHVLIVGWAVGQPSVLCDLFRFGNSDGSTHPAPINAETASNLIKDMMARTVTYCYKQIH
jgi:hypothetical protein